MRRTPHVTPCPSVPVLPTILPGSGEIPELPAVENTTPLREDVFPLPAYAENFHCIGPQCEDSCCRAWDLRLDRATYERYQLIPAESLLGRTVERSVRLLAEPRTDHAYARILLNDALECPFLTEESWCGIQHTLGEEALSQTCRSYPRIKRNSPTGQLETTLHLSCPEAARLVLLDAGSEKPNGRRHEDSGHSAEAAYEAVVVQSTRRMAEAEGKEISEGILGAIRGFLLVLLRDRRYSVGERVWLMGVFAGRLQSEIRGVDAKSVQRLPELLGEFCRLAAAGTLLPALEQVAGQPTMQLALTLRMINQRLDRAMNSLRFLDDVKVFLDGSGYAPGKTPEDLAPALQRAEDEYFAPWLEAHPWLLENYLTHALERSGFPFVRDWNCFEPASAFHALCTHYVVIRTLLAGLAGAHGEGFRVEHAVRLVQAYSRMVDHHAEFLAASAGMLGDVNWTDAGSLAGLLLEGRRIRPNAPAMA